MRDTTTKSSKSTKRLRKQHLRVALIISFLLIVSSFSVAYFNFQRSSRANTTDCIGAAENDTMSADGLVIATEADLRCAGKIERESSSQELFKSISVLLGIVGVGLAIVALSLLLKKRGH